jgi:hypothetical protein
VGQPKAAWRCASRRGPGRVWVARAGAHFLFFCGQKRLDMALVFPLMFVSSKAYELYPFLKGAHENPN